MKCMMIGDIFARPGRRAMRECLSALVDEHQVDFVVANAENAAAGFGLTEKIADELFDYGVDVLTGGNHSWDKRQGYDLLDNNERVLRPHNYPASNPGSGVAMVKCDGVAVAVLNLQGRVFMPLTHCPFGTADRLVESVKDEADVILVDFHGEATSEKLAMGWHLDGRVSALVGTHTHVPTADARVFPGGMAYVTDLGMTGPHHSIIGVKVEQSLARFLHGRSDSRFEPASGDVRLQGVVIDIDESSGRARSIERVEARVED
jgi:metallophosphoesterase (TIGR00282 family)